jgi:Ring finger domain
LDLEQPFFSWFVSAQLALAIMESQRQMMEGGYGHPDGENNRSAGVKDEAKAKWHTFLFKPDKHKNLVAKGHYGSVSLNDDDDLVKKPAAGTSGGLASQDEEPHCSICLGEYEDGEKLTKLPCGHLFHDECIGSWCKNHTRCPLCNSDLNTVISGNDNIDEIV